MEFYESNAEIRASPQKIWALLTDAQGYPAWNSTVERVEGRIEKGQTIKVFVKVNPGRAFPVKVTEFDPPRRMVWSGGMPLGLFQGRADVRPRAGRGRGGPVQDARGIHRAYAADDLEVDSGPGTIVRRVRAIPEGGCGSGRVSGWRVTAPKRIPGV